MPNSVIISIQSDVVRGHVGNGAARFALQRIGCDVWALPTVLLSNHPGHGQARGRSSDANELMALFAGLQSHHWIAQAGAVLSGYLASPEQAVAVAQIVREVKRANPSALFLCDPVFGDDDGAYAKLGVAEAISRELMPLADITTPNRFELSSLTSQRIDTPHDAVRAARMLGIAEVIVTSVPDRDMIANVAVTAREAWCCRVAREVNVPHGTGDLLSALYLAARIRGDKVQKALNYSVSRVQAIIGKSLAQDELQLVAAQDFLIEPAASLAVEPL